MDDANQVKFLDYEIRIVQDGSRYIAYVRCDGQLIEHDGRASEVWASASCGTRDRAIWVAKNAINTNKIFARTATS